MLGPTSPCYCIFFPCFPGALGPLFVFTPSSHSRRMKSESTTLSSATSLAYRSHFRMNCKYKDFSSAEKCSCTASLKAAVFRAESVAKFYTQIHSIGQTCVSVQCIYSTPFQGASKWILCIYFGFNKGNLSSYLHCIVIYKVIKSWNNWLNAIAKPFIERIPQRRRDILLPSMLYKWLLFSTFSKHKTTVRWKKWPSLLRGKSLETGAAGK